jgi:hypothetical protein
VRRRHVGSMRVSRLRAASKLSATDQRPASAHRSRGAHVYRDRGHHPGRGRRPAMRGRQGPDDGSGGGGHPPRKSGARGTALGRAAWGLPPTDPPAVRVGDRAWAAFPGRLRAPGSGTRRSDRCRVGDGTTARGGGGDDPHAHRRSADSVHGYAVMDEWVGARATAADTYGALSRDAGRRVASLLDGLRSAVASNTFKAGWYTATFGPETCSSTGATLPGTSPGGSSVTSGPHSSTGSSYATPDGAGRAHWNRARRCSSIGCGTSPTTSARRRDQTASDIGDG